MARELISMSAASSTASDRSLPASRIKRLAQIENEQLRAKRYYCGFEISVDIDQVHMSASRYDSEVYDTSRYEPTKKSPTFSDGVETLQDTHWRVDLLRRHIMASDFCQHSNSMLEFQRISRCCPFLRCCCSSLSPYNPPQCDRRRYEQPRYSPALTASLAGTWT
jgi:hypothetical protein